jgi:hypothetical protein
VKQIAALGKPTALVTIAGHSIALPEACHLPAPKTNANNVDDATNGKNGNNGKNGGDATITTKASAVSAVLYAFLPSQAGGTALVSTLLGDHSPAGRLPVTFYDRSILKSRSPFDMSLR